MNSKVLVFISIFVLVNTGVLTPALAEEPSRIEISSSPPPPPPPYVRSPVFAPEANSMELALIQECRDQLINRDFSWIEAEERCKKNIRASSQRQAFSAWVKAFSNCYDLHRESGIGSSQSRLNCEGPTAAIKNLTESFSDPDMKSCHRVVRQIGGGDRAPLDCLFAPNYRENENAGEFKACLKRSVQSASAKFFTSTRRWNERPVWNDEGGVLAGPYTLIIDQCNQDLNQAPAPLVRTGSLLQYLGIQHFHTQDHFSPKMGFSRRIGGLSGISYSEQNDLFYAISDSQNDPAIFSFKLTWKRTVPGAFSVEATDYNALSGVLSSWSARTDHEDIAALKNGKYILVSEPSHSLPMRNSHYYQETSRQSDSDHSAEPWLSVYSASGYMEKTIAIPEAFLPSYGYKSVSSQESSGQQRADQYSVDNPPPPGFEPEKQNSKVTYVERILEAGMKVNEGLESLAISPSQTRLFIGNERALAQDEKNSVRIQAFHDIEGDWMIGKSFRYLLDAIEGNSLVALVALSEDVLLTLERAFNEKTRLVTSKIFCVRLQSGSSNAPLNKKMILDLDQILPQLPAGFRRLENYEGMTLGPKTVDGAETLVLVSDNNFSKDQTTNFLILSFASKLRETCGVTTQGHGPSEVRPTPVVPSTHPRVW